MALPQIQELEPWLEEDEEVFFGYCKETTCQNNLQKPARLSFRAVIMTLAKFSFYSYLILKMHRKGYLLKLFYLVVSLLSKRLGGFSTATFAVLVYFLKRYQQKLAL
jgi:hypothetical protein